MEVNLTCVEVRRKEKGSREENDMKEVRHYICDICHTEYNDKLSCQNCEKSHKKTGKIVREHYISFTQNKTGYPYKIEVEFEDGAVITYKR